MKKRNIIFLIIVVVIIASILIIIKNATSDGLDLMKLNNMYNDIEILENRISIYYLNYGYIPIKKDNKYEFNSNSINPNDNSEYYEIDLEKLENLDLSYGDKIFGNDDIYIINEQSHTIYYYKGIEYKGKKYYTIKENYEKVELENYN